MANSLGYYTSQEFSANPQQTNPYYQIDTPYTNSIAYADPSGGGGGGGGFGNFLTGGGLGNLINGGLGLYSLISGINQNNQLGSGLSNVANLYGSNITGNQGLSGQLLNYLSGGGLSSILNSAANPLSPSGAANSYLSAISGALPGLSSALSQSYLGSMQPYLQDVAGQVTGNAQNLANTQAQQFGIANGQPLTGAGGANNLEQGILSSVPSAIQQAQQSVLPGLQGFLQSGLSGLTGAFGQGLTNQYAEPNNLANIIGSLLGGANQSSLYGLSGLGNLLTNQQSNANQQQANAAAAAQSSGSQSGGFGNFVGSLLGGIGSIFGL